VGLIWRSSREQSFPLKHHPKGEKQMDQTIIYEKVKAIIVDKLNVKPEDVVEDAKFRENLKADSLDLVELIMAFEEEFGGTISDEDAQKITSVGEAVKYLSKAGA
jgi:acyl carrier protein